MSGPTILLPDSSATFALGFRLGETAGPGDIVTLAGPLGAGKTTLTQAIGQGLGVPSSCYITSPTFGLLHEYPGRLPLFHMDLYRLRDESELEELGFTEILYDAGLSVIEWPDRLGSMMPEDRLHIDLVIVSETVRQARLTIHGRGWGQMNAEQLRFLVHERSDGNE